MVHLKMSIIFWMTHFCYLIGMHHARKFHRWNDRFEYCKKKWDNEIY